MDGPRIAAVQGISGDVVMSAQGIDCSQARQVAERLRALEASGVRLTESQRWVLKCCERRVALALALERLRLAETFATPKEMP